MNKTLTQVIILIIGLAILIPITDYFKIKLDNFKKSQENSSQTAPAPIVEKVKSKETSVKDISFVVDGETYNLANGQAENETVPGSGDISSLEIFGEPVYADFNGDGIKDAAVWLVSHSGGTGVFYYAVLAINTSGEYKATNALFLGDRIAPQTLEVQGGKAVYNFADRNIDEPMTAEPSIGKSFYVNYDKETGQISEWVKYKDDTNKDAKVN